MYTVIIQEIAFVHTVCTYRLSIQFCMYTKFMYTIYIRMKRCTYWSQLYTEKMTTFQLESESRCLFDPHPETSFEPFHVPFVFQVIRHFIPPFNRSDSPGKISHLNPSFLSSQILRTIYLFNLIKKR